MAESLSPKEIQVNVVLEDSPTNRLNQQTVRMVGFVIINDPHIKLSDLRLKILSELDEQQLQITGLNFKFLKKTFPVSSKQEKSLTMKKICVNTITNTLPNANDIQPSNPTSPAPNINAQHTKNNNLIMNEDEKQASFQMSPNTSHTTNIDNNLDVMQSFDQCMSLRINIKSPIIQNTCTNEPIINTNNNNNNNNQSAFPKVTMCTVPDENEMEYTVLIRACHIYNVLAGELHPCRSESDLTLHSLLDIDENTILKDKNNNNNEQISPVPNKNHKKDTVKFKNKEIEKSFSACFLSSYPISPKSTRLETQLGEKLPRIAPKKSTDSQFTKPSNEVDIILKKAMSIRNNINGFLTVEEKKEDIIEDIDFVSESISISLNENTNLKKVQDTTLVTPPQKQTKSNETNVAFNYLIDDNILCKFTVIGSPMIYNNNNNNNNIVWEFENESDLIKGLSGVHHSVSNPLWIDLVCDRHRFINIAEHIRPSIHVLTIEDCLTIHCREKLEIFKDYLFICLRTPSDDYSTTQTINILIFKTMIITYHLGHILTLSVIENVNLILNKKFGNICPSPSWICHAIIDNVIDNMMPEVESIVREVETCEQFIFKLCNESQTELLHRMQNARAWIVLYRSRLSAKSTIAHNLLNNYLWRKDFLSDVPQPYWRDINDHVVRMVDVLELGTQTLQSIQNIFVAKVSLQMTQQSNNLAKVGGKLAGVGAVFLPLTVITGIWGMNCKVPFQYAPDANTTWDNNIYGFIIVLVVMLFSSIFTWKFVNRKGWVHANK